MRMCRDKPTVAVNRLLMMGELCVVQHVGWLRLKQTRYMWEAKWWTNKAPYHYSLGEWVEGGVPFVCSPDGSY